MSTTGVTTARVPDVGASTSGVTTAPAPADRRADTPPRSSHGLARPRRRPAPRPAAEPARAPRDHHHPYRIAEEPHP
ncbi:hypothetical protein ACQEVM_23170 [Streptomyces sp. CA-243310]|uniref:hypothetical protein n=1 Tax=Streptomyces sp. CA-243310 TaxID=3240056 RepID=UPI003D8DC9F6